MPICYIEPNLTKHSTKYESRTIIQLNNMYNNNLYPKNIICLVIRSDKLERYIKLDISTLNLAGVTIPLQYIRTYARIGRR